MTTFSLRKASAVKTSADALVVGVVKTADGPRLAPGGEDVAAALGRSFAGTLDALGVTGGTDEVVKVPGGGAVKAPVLVLVGLGHPDQVSPEVLRRAAGAAARALSKSKQVCLALPAHSVEQIRAIVEGVVLGGYVYDRYLSGDKPAPIRDVTVLTGLARDKAAKAVVDRAEALASAVNVARTWVNTPAADLTPAVFADDIVAKAKGTDVKVEVLDDAQLEQRGCGGILGVGRGSSHPPRLVTLTYRPRKATAHVSFVGKGITFDSGGLSLKPGPGMYSMKCDMSGAAAVVAATFAIAELGLPIQVTAYASLAENMPSGTATRPGDVLRMYGGKTVEVLNTDAEGRLVLADALTMASEQRPDVLIDVATLTGACVVALGKRTAGIMANDEALQRSVQACATAVGENMWPLPLPEEMHESVRSTKIADLSQIQIDKAGGALFAGAFLREFVGDGISWAHLDIAGTAFNDGAPWGYTPKGGTGAAVRTLVQLASERAAAR